MFVNAAITSTAQREFRRTPAEQRMSLDFLHEYVLGNYRELYAATLALDINHLNAALIVTNLLRTAADAGPATARCRGAADRGAGWRCCPRNGCTPCSASCAGCGVNNRRTRAIMRDWVAARPDPAFDAVKYRRSLSVAARHAHLRLPDEVGTALFDWRRPKRYDTPILESWRRAHYRGDVPSTTCRTRWPRGWPPSAGINRTRFLTTSRPRLTAGERLRLQGTGRRSGVDALAMDLAGAPLTRLAAVRPVAAPRRASPPRRRIDHRAAGGGGPHRRRAGRQLGRASSRCSTTASRRPGRGSSAVGRWPSPSPPTTCWRRSRASTPGCG